MLPARNMNSNIVGLQVGGANVFGIGVAVVVLCDVRFRQLEAGLGKIRVLLKRAAVLDDRFVVLLLEEVLLRPREVLLALPRQNRANTL